MWNATELKLFDTLIRWEQECNQTLCLQNGALYQKTRKENAFLPDPK